jgi:hypothetical protein
MNGYICTYKSKRIEIQADTSYKAQCKAASELGVSDKKRYMISVTLCELSDGKQVEHTPLF